MILCPCVEDEPCSQNCTCRYPYKSGGCIMCVNEYGSKPEVAVPQDVLKRIIEGLLNRGEIDIAAMLKRYLPKPPKLKIYIYISERTGDYIVQEFASNNPYLRLIEEREIDTPKHSDS